MTTSSAINRLRNGQYRTQNHAQMEKIYEENEQFRESYDQMAASLASLRAEEEGWIPINRLQESDGFSLSAIQEISALADLQTTGNPLLSRGLDLHLSYVWGKGVSFKRKPGKKAIRGDISARAQAIWDKPANQNVLVTQEAFEQLERKAFTVGNMIMAYRKSTESFFPIPFNEISNHASNPDLEQDIWYYQRTWTETDLNTGQPKSEPTVRWYATLEKIEGVKKADRRQTIGGIAVDDDVILIDERFNRTTDGVWGVPDCLPAMQYSWGHGQYIRNAAKMLEAQQQIAWKVVARTKKNSINAGVKMSDPKRAGSTATMTAETDLEPLKIAGNVNMKDGQTMASYVAAALKVSLVALLSDPGAAQGSYGAAAALLPSEANSTRARQARWSNFFARCWRAIGVSDVDADFPKLIEDPIHRQNQSLALGFEKGAIHQDEYRAAVIEANDIVPLHDELPEPSPFTVAASKLRAELDAADEAADLAASGLSAQGVSGTVGALADGDNGNRDES